MPEGDTILRTAVRLREVLAGCTIDRARGLEAIPPIEELTGARVRDLEARGKHLLIHFEDRRALHTHLGMTGSWHRYRPGERWSKPSHRAAVVLETQEWLAVCFSPKTLELLSAVDLKRHAWLRQLGPDLLNPSVDLDLVVERFQQRADLTLGVAVMDQRICCGIGNVYKSEVLFLERLHPWELVGRVPQPRLHTMVGRAQRLMRRNLDGQPRRTRFLSPGTRVWVYGRQGDPCMVCGTTIRMQRQSDLGRSTYWCPACQVHLDGEADITTA